MISDRRIAGYVLAGLGAALFSTKAIFIKLAFQDQVDAALMLAYRMIFALPIFAGIGAVAYARRRARGKAAPSANAVGLAMLTGFFGTQLTFSDGTLMRIEPRTAE